MRTGLSSIGLRFDSQYSHDSSHPSVTPVPGIRHPLLPSMGTRATHGAQTKIQAKYSYMQK